MVHLCMGFEVYRPFRLNPAFDPGKIKKVRNIAEAYFSDSNREILQRVCEKCYIPATQLMLELLDEGFKCAFSLSGTLVEQLERWNGDALELFRQMARHRNAELLSQTYYHSVASLFDDLGEFEEQVRLHRFLMRDVFSFEPQVLENTEFIFNNAIAAAAARLGFKAVCIEGVQGILGWRSPNYVYFCRGTKVLMRNFPLSDDIAFRFTNRARPSDGQASFRQSFCWLGNSRYPILPALNLSKIGSDLGMVSFQVALPDEALHSFAIQAGFMTRNAPGNRLRVYVFITPAVVKGDLENDVEFLFV
jgi:alpha-amylase/alpha-mannosidase (GH57 family)